MITARSKVCGLIANPIGHSLSPLIQNCLSELMGADQVYIPLPVEENLKDAIAGAYALGIEGINISLPYKKDVIRFLTGLDQAAAEVGAVNTLVRGLAGYRGYNTDLPGLKKAVRVADIALSGKPVILLGAGGAAKAAAHLAASGGAASLVILNRSREKADELAGEIGRSNPGFPVATDEISGWKKLKGSGYVAIQSTSVGMFPNASRCVMEEEGFYEKCEAGIDLVYTPSETVFLKNMKKAGARTLGGLSMLVYQAVLSWELWNLGIKVPEDVIRKLYDAAAAALREREGKKA